MTDLSTLTTSEIETKLNELDVQRKNYIAVQCEGYDHGTPWDQEINYFGSELALRMRAAADAAFAAEWTIETFSARKAAWNTEAAKLPRSAKGVKYTDIRALETRLGYTMDSLMRAKTMLGA